MTVESSGELISLKHAPAVVIHCSDELRRRGLVSVFDQSGSTIEPYFSSRDDSPIPRPELALIVFPDSARRADRFRCLQRVPVEWSIGTGPVGIAVCRKPLDLMLVLRFVESGISYLIGYDEIADEPTGLLSLHEGVDDRHRLPTSWELREQLGLRWDGDMRQFCEVLATVPSGTWIEEWKQSRLPIPRRRIQSLRQSAYDVAGIPPPDALRFSTACRRPLWADVRAVVHRLWGIHVDDHEQYG